MTTEAPRILPQDLAYEIESFVDSQLADAARYDNRQPLDDSGVFTLHRLAARIYAAGYEAGERSATVRESAASRRARERERAANSGGGEPA